MVLEPVVYALATRDRTDIRVNLDDVWRAGLARSLTDSDNWLRAGRSSVVVPALPLDSGGPRRRNPTAKDYGR